MKVKHTEIFKQTCLYFFSIFNMKVNIQFEFMSNRTVTPPPPHLSDFLILSPGAYLLPGSESSIMWDDIFLNSRYEWRIIKLLKSCPALSPRAYRMTCRKCELSSPGSASREPRETILRTMRRPCPPNTSCSWLSRGRPLTICCLLCCVGGYKATNGLLFICLGLFLFWKKNFCWGKGLAFKESHTKQRTFLIYICLTSE